MNDAKQKAIQWAKEILQKPFVIFDTETTGFRPEHEIITIAVITSAGQSALTARIKPVGPIENSHIHGITSEMVADCPGFPEIYPDVRAALEGQIVVAYNSAYDWKMLDQVCGRHSLPRIIPASRHCAMLMFADYNGEWDRYHQNNRWKKLGEALASFGLTHEDVGGEAHDALGDVLATLRVIQCMAG